MKMIAPTDTLMFPAGTILTLRGQPVAKPWGQHPTEPFRAQILGPMPLPAVIDTLTALWGTHDATGATLQFSGEEGLGAFLLGFAPEVGFTTPDGAGTYTEPGLREVVEAHYAAPSAA